MSYKPTESGRIHVAIDSDRRAETGEGPAIAGVAKTSAGSCHMIWSGMERCEVVLAN